ncbi:hypothetical protein HUK80_02705 [Flavobacterium sp. MAH-1]|uniref:Signal transduction histidine kinase n=1 Tax=Flavobacterium agri TaxID=2743471 RepID=A0A7Y8XZY0_9FLAO|nr:7TM diverse intracellular signaling domain-containing protein [Flavobacterium agri]NUY79791.1 hypothetical protein [Flavobacterium agri]NYA69816.1 hypothetical protein [Flavobacterium agri]
MSLFILGATVLAFIYHVVLYAFNKDRLLIHYLVYLFFTSVFLFLKTGLILYFFGSWERYILHNFREAIQIVYLASYFNFIVEAVGISKQKNTFLFRYWNITAAFLILYALIYTVCKLYADVDNEAYAYAFIGIRIFIFGVTGAMLYQSFKLREIKFQLIILYGCTIYMICGLTSFITNLFSDPAWLIWPLEWLMIGSFLDIIFFSLAIGYRNKLQWESLNLTLLEEANKFIALQKVILAKQTELENERQRIAADMHDDLGSGLTKITYLSQMAQHGDLGDNLEKIQKTANELIGNMSELIWVMKDENNTLEDLATYIKSYAVDYFESNDIDIQVSLPDDFQNITLDGKQRRHLFLCVKEALHNIVKHANATKVLIKMSFNSGFTICIKDNGVGLNENGPKNPLHGNGIKNMRSRMETICGSMEVVETDGIAIIFNIPLSFAAENEPFVPLPATQNELSFAPQNLKA